MRLKLGQPVYGIDDIESVQQLPEHFRSLDGGHTVLRMCLPVYLVPVEQGVRRLGSGIGLGWQALVDK